MVRGVATRFCGIPRTQKQNLETLNRIQHNRSNNLSPSSHCNQASVDDICVDTNAGGIWYTHYGKIRNSITM